MPSRPSPCRGLTKRFGTTLAVDHVDLEVAEGEIFGLLGPNGAGKTTTIRVLTTLIPPDEGSVAVFGRDVARDPFADAPPDRLRAPAAVGRRRPDRPGERGAVHPVCSTCPARARQEPGRRRARRRWASAMPPTGWPRPTRAAWSAGSSWPRRWSTSRGCWSSTSRPSGSIPSAARACGSASPRSGPKSSMTVLVTTHYMEEADEACDRVALMHRGRIQVLGAPSALKAALAADATLEDVFRHHTGDGFAEGGTCVTSVAPVAPLGVSADAQAGGARLRRWLALVRQPHRHVLHRRGAEAAPRPLRAGHPGDPAGAVAGHLRHDVQPAARHPVGRRVLPRLPGPGRPGPVDACSSRSSTASR